MSMKLRSQFGLGEHLVDSRLGNSVRSVHRGSMALNMDLPVGCTMVEVVAGQDMVTVLRVGQPKAMEQD